MRRISIYEDGRSQIEHQTLPTLAEREVLIETQFSGVNYKDALAITSKGKILKEFPLTPGIDLSGTVIDSRSNQWKEGDSVLINGCGMGEEWNGAYASFVVASEDNIVPLPKSMSPKEAMIYGTAGFTAALALHRMEQNGQNPSMGPILVTGASGGVGSFAVSLFAAKNYEVIALSSKESEFDNLKKLGAGKVILPKDLVFSNKPLDNIKFGGAVDNLGGQVLSKLLASIQLWGNVASIGLALDPRIDTSVMPLILRGVSLIGVSSNNTPMDLRKKLWENLANSKLETSLEIILRKELRLEEISSYSKAMLENKTSGRAIVNLANY